MSTPQLRPLRVGETLDAAIKVYRRNFGELAKIVLLVVLPFEALAALVLASEVSGTTLVGGKFLFASRGDLDAYAVAGAVLSVLIGLVVLIANAACFKAVSDTYLGESPRWRESVRFAVARLGSVVWLSILTFIIIVLGLLALVLPGIYLAIAFSVAMPVLLVERVGGFKALSRSFELTKGRWWATLGTLIVAFILIAVIQAIVAAILGGVIRGIFNEGGSPVLVVVLQRLLNGLSNVISIPFYAACVTVIYYDLRVRKEGYDLQLLAEGIGRAAPVSSSAGSGGTSALPTGDEPSGLERPPAPPAPGGSIPPPSPGAG